jgi:hypothetical protein
MCGKAQTFCRAAAMLFTKQARSVRPESCIAAQAGQGVIFVVNLNRAWKRR